MHRSVPAAAARVYRNALAAFLPVSRNALTAFLLAWVAALSTGPFFPVPIAGMLYAAGSLICHQIPERSFHLDSFQLPVCARCFGLYAGGAAGSLAAVIVDAGVKRRVFSTIARRRYVLTIAAALPTLLTLVLERGFGWPLSNEIRAVAAVPLAAAVAFVVMSAVATLH